MAHWHLFAFDCFRANKKCLKTFGSAGTPPPLEKTHIWATIFIWKASLTDNRLFASGWIPAWCTKYEKMVLNQLSLHHAYEPGGTIFRTSWGFFRSPGCPRCCMDSEIEDWPFFFSKIAKNYVISSIHQKTTKIGFVPPILGKIHFWFHLRFPFGPILNIWHAFMREQCWEDQNLW